MLKMRKLKNILFIVATVAILMIPSCIKEPASHRYAYEVAGSGYSYDVTIIVSPNVTRQYTGVSSGWRYEWVQVDDVTKYLSISARNDTTSDNVIVRITRDDVVLTSDENSGPHAVAAVSGTY